MGVTVAAASASGPSLSLSCRGLAAELAESGRAGPMTIHDSDDSDDQCEPRAGPALEEPSEC
jgi:hypothetical protein